MKQTQDKPAFSKEYFVNLVGNIVDPDGHPKEIRPSVSPGLMHTIKIIAITMAVGGLAAYVLNSIS